VEKLLSYLLQVVVGKPLAYSDRLRVAALTILAAYFEREALLGDAIVYGTFALGCAFIIGLSLRDAPAGTTALLPKQGS
jgi:hypothetical protein